MSHYSQIHNDDPFWYADEGRKDPHWGWWLAILIVGIMVGLIAFSCIDAHQNPPEVKTVPVGHPG